MVNLAAQILHCLGCEMGNPCFWYYPGGSGSGAIELEIPGPLSDLIFTPLRDRRSGWTLAGEMRSAVNSGRMRVTISCGPFNNTGNYQHLPYQLESMSAHLEKGGAVSFCADKDKAVASFINAYSTSTTTSICTLSDPNVFAAYNGSAALVTDDIVCIESPNPELNREYSRLSANLTATTLSLADPMRYDHKESPLMVRYRDFFPVLYMPQDRLGTNMITHEHRNTFTLDLTLEQSVDGFVKFYPDPVEVPGIELTGPGEQRDPPEGAGSWTLDEAIHRLEGTTATKDRNWRRFT